MRTQTARRLLPSDDRGSMAFYLVISMVGLALAALLMPMIVTTAANTRSDTTRLQAVDAARAGTNVVLGKIRSAQSSGGVGSSPLLPCATSTLPLTGTVNGSGDQSYSVTVDYYLSDPVTSPSQVKMMCVPGAGTYLNGTFTPNYARITAVGSAGSSTAGTTAGRTLISTYAFKTTNTNVVGGQIQIYPTSTATTNYCMDAGSATPTTGTVLKLQACATPASSQQIFAYRSDLTLQLLSSVTTAVPLGMCLDTAAPPTQGNSIVLNPCTALGSPTYTQQWSFNDNGGFTASTSTSATNGTLSSQCMSAASQNAGIAVKLDSCGNGGVSSPTQAWIPSPSVGSGAAVSVLAFGTTQQLVNYAEFGRCLDVTGQNVNASHLIDYPCKQNPYAAAVAWNQKFTTPALSGTATSTVGQIYTTTGGTTYCLTSPATTGGYVTIAVCSSSNANQTWTLYNGDSTLTYSKRYTIVDSGGRCLGLTTAVTGETWSAIDVEACTGGTDQKWNATANLTSSALTNITEPRS